MNPRLLQTIGQPDGFGLDHFAAKRRQAIVAPALIRITASGPLTVVEFDDHSLLQHPLDAPVESAGAQSQLTAGLRGDVLHDCVAVLVASGEGDENLKDLRRKREKIARVGIAT